MSLLEPGNQGALGFALTLLGSTFVFALLFALLGGVLLDRQKQQHWGALCAGLGLLIAFPLFTCLTLWLRPSIALGLSLALLVVLWLRIARREPGVLLARLGCSIRQALWLTAIAILFWLPAVAGRYVGLFTEAGGDFTIYAGVPAKLGDAPLWTGADVRDLIQSLTTGGPFPPAPRALSGASQPPAPGWSMQRLIETGWTAKYAGWFGLQHVLFRLPLGDLSAQFLALLAVLWSLMVAVPHRLVALRAGRVQATLTLALFASAHGLIAIGYNHFYPHLLAGTMVLCLLAIIYLPNGVRVTSTSLLALVALTFLSVGVAYYPITLILVVPALSVVLYRARSCFDEALADWRSARPGLRWLTFFAAVCIGVMAVFLYGPQLPNMMDMVSRFVDVPDLVEVQRDTRNLGPPRPYDLAQVAMIFGTISVYSLHALAGASTENLVVNLAAVSAIVASLSVAAYVFFLVRQGALNRTVGPAIDDMDAVRLARSFTLALIPYAVLQVLIGRHYEYTQFKAAAYVAPLILLWLSLPVALLPGAGLLRSLVWTAAAAKIVLIAALLFFRIDGALTIALERVGVADIRLSGLIDLVRQRDDRAFVLAYLPNSRHFASWELVLRDVRALAMNHHTYTAPKASYVDPSDPPHLWIVREGQAADLPPDALTRGPFWAYRPFSSRECRVEAAPLNRDNAGLVGFNLLGRRQERLWSQRDNEFWIFNGDTVPAIDLALKDHTGLAGRSALGLQLRYPVDAPFEFRVARRSGDEALVTIPREALLAPLAERPFDLIVLQVPGTGYSGLFCRK